MRINRSFPLEKLFAAIEYYIETTNRRVTFEYIMLNGVNDTPENAQELADLTKRRLIFVNSPSSVSNLLSITALPSLFDDRVSLCLNVIVRKLHQCPYHVLDEQHN